MDTRRAAVHLSDVASRFNARPLFDDALSRELERYEQRTLAQREVPNDHNRFANARDEEPLSAFRKRAVLGASSIDDSRLPPSIPRPWSVDHLIQRSKWVGAGTVPTPVNDSDVPDDERREFLDGVKDNPRVKQRKRDEKSGLGIDESSSNNSGTPVPKRSVRRQPRRTHQDLSDDSHDYRYNSDFYTSRLGGKRRGSEVHSDGPPPLVDQAIHPIPLSDELLGTHIERAQARKHMQEARLGSLGIRAPGTRVEFSTQTEGQMEEDLVLGNTATERKVHAQNQSDKGWADSPSEGLVLLPQVPYREAAASENHTSSGTETVWHKMLTETKRRENFPSAYQMPEVENPWLTILGSNSSAAPSGARLSTVIPGAEVRHSVPTGPPPRAMYDQLDRMQLDHEELLLRNNILKDPLPSSFGGVFGAATDEEQMVRDAIAHVAAAHRDPHAHEEVMARFRPTGGYGSVTDSPSRAHTSDRSQTDRWKAAKHNMDRDQGASHAMVPLRRWATELPTKYVGSVSNDEVASLRTAPTSAGATWDNPAKRKWGNISFTAPDQSLPQGTLEGISQLAKSRMAPDFS